MAFAPLWALPPSAQPWDACGGSSAFVGACEARRMAPAGPASRTSSLPAAAPALARRAGPQSAADVAGGGSAPVGRSGAGRSPTSAFDRSGTFEVCGTAGDVVRRRPSWAGRGIGFGAASALHSGARRAGGSTLSGLPERIGFRVETRTAPACAAEEGGKPKARRGRPKKSAAEDDGEPEPPSSPEPAAGAFDEAASRRFLRERCGLSDADIDRLRAKKPQVLKFDPAEAGRVVDLLEAAAGAGEAAREEPPLAGDGDSGPTAQRQQRAAQRAAQQRQSRLRMYAQLSIIRRSAQEAQQRLAAWRAGVGERGLKAIVRRCRAHNLLDYDVGGIQELFQLFKEAEYAPEQIARIAQKHCGSFQLSASVGDRIDKLAAALERFNVDKEMVREITSENPELLQLRLKENIEPKLALLREWGMTRDDIVKLLKRCNFSTSLDTMQATFELLRDGIFGGDAFRARRTIFRGPRLLGLKTSTVEDGAKSLAEAIEGAGAPLSVVADLVCGSAVLQANADTLAERVHGLRSMGVEKDIIRRHRILYERSWERRIVPRLVALRLWGLQGIQFTSFVGYTDGRAAARLGLSPAAYGDFVGACAYLLGAPAYVPAPALCGVPLAALRAGPGALKRRRAAFEAAGGSGGAAFAAWLAERGAGAEAEA